MKYLIAIVFFSCYGYSYSQVITTHPRLFLSSDKITRLQNRANNNTTSWNQVQSLTTLAMAQSSAVLAADATGAGRQYVFPLMLSYFATGNTAHRDKATEILVTYCINHTTNSQISQLTGPGRHNEIAELSIAYDWCYPYLSAADRTTIRNRIIAWADYIITNTSHPGNMATNNYYEGDFALLGNFYALVAAAYAIHSEDNAKGNQYLGVINTVLPRLMTFIGTRLNNGDANEGWATIGVHSIHSLFRSFAIIKTASSAGTDKFQETLYDQQVIKFLAHATTPSNNNLVLDGELSSLQLYDFHRHVSDIISSYSDDAETRGVAKYFSINHIPFSQFKNNVRKSWSFLLLNEEEQTLDYRTLPSYGNKRVFTGESGTGQFLGRSSWNTDAQWVNFKAGGHYGQRASDGQGHFSLYENGWLIIDSNMTTLPQSGIVTQDIARNVVQFTPGNTNTQVLFPVNGFSNAEHSQFIHTELAQNFSYFKVNNTPIYTPRFNNSVYAAFRSFLYIPNEKVLFVYDEAANTSPTYSPNFALHFPDDNFTTNANNKVITYANTQTTVYDHILIPEEISITEGRANGNGGVRVSSTSHGWHGVSSNVFLQCIYTNPNASGARDVTIMNNNNFVTMGGLYGAFFRNTDRNNLVVLHGYSVQYQKDSVHYHCTSTGATNHIIVQLKPNTMYYLHTNYDAINHITYVELSTESSTGTQLLSSSTGSIEFTTNIAVGKIKNHTVTSIFEEPLNNGIMYSHIDRDKNIFVYDEKDKTLRESAAYDMETHSVWLTKDLKYVIPVLWVNNSHIWLTDRENKAIQHIMDIENATGEIFYIDENGDRLLAPYSIDYTNGVINFTHPNGNVTKVATIDTEIADRNTVGTLRPDQYIALLIASGCIQTPFSNNIPSLFKSNSESENPFEKYTFLSLTPNPSNSSVKLTFHSETNDLPTIIKVYDALGNLMKTESYNLGAINEIVIQVNDLSVGNYTISVQNGGKHNTLPFQVVR